MNDGITFDYNSAVIKIILADIGDSVDNIISTLHERVLDWLDKNCDPSDYRFIGDDYVPARKKYRVGVIWFRHECDFLAFKLALGL